MGNVVSYCEPEEQEEEPVAEEAQEEPSQDAEDAEVEEDAEEEEPKPEIIVRTAPFDTRFPSTNQARNCYTRYNEFYRCAAEKGEEDEDCKFYQRAYRSICPGEWVERWNEQRDNGNWPGKY